jgi:hypothetical protein
MAAPDDDGIRWNRLYGLVIAALIFEIAVFWAITRAFS